MKKTIKPWLIILSALTMLIGTLYVGQISCKIYETSISLAIIRDNAKFYNESSRKSDEMTDGYMEDYEERQAIYKSEDFVIRTFSNQNILVKLLVLCLTILVDVMVLAMWFEHFRIRLDCYKRIQAKKAKRVPIRNT